MASETSVLDGILAKDLLEPNFKLVTLNHDANVKRALEVLASSRVYSLPVLDGHGSCLGLLDLGDLVSHLASCFYKHGGCSNYEELWNCPTASFKAAEIEADFYSAPVSGLLNASGENAYSPLPAASTTLKQALQALTKLRRLPLVDGSGHVQSIISQTNIIRYLGKHKQLIPACVASKTIEELGAVTRPVLTMNENQRAVDAFALFAAKQFSGVAITDASGEPAIIATVSVKDFTLLSQNFAYVFLPVEEYVKTVRQQDLHTIYPTVSVKSEELLSVVVAKFAATRMHRFLVHPVGSASGYDGVVALGNVLAVLAKSLHCE